MSEQESTLKLLYSEEQIQKRITRMATQIEQDYFNKYIHLIGVLRGGAPITWELAKRLQEQVSIMDFIRISSYDGTKSGEAKECLGLSESIAGHHVLIVEDIIDTGNTINYLLHKFRNAGASSVKVCSLLDKPTQRKVDVTADYVGFTIPNVFVVGFGLDYDQKYRALPFIAELEL